MKKELLIDLVKGTFAGIMIGIGGTVYLNSSNNFIGACLFSIGLLMICIYKMNLFTGMVGYILVNKKSYIWSLIATLIGNFIGTYLCALAVYLTRLNSLYDKAKNLAEIKINDSYLSVFILAIFCGILMYIAVNNFKKCESYLIKCLSIIICVVVFIIAGFEHSIANMFYISLAHAWSIKALISILFMILGNACGAVLIASLDNYNTKHSQ